MSEYRPTEYVVDFGDCRSNRFVGLNMTLIKQNGAKLQERIVRCKDCVAYEPYHTYAGMKLDYGECMQHRRQTNDDRFCWWAERRTDDN